MAKFRKLPVLVDAEQWFPDHLVEDVIVVPTQIIFSVDRAWYYVERGGDLCTHWLSVTQFEEKFETGPFDGGVEIKPKGKDPYFRKTKPFQFWKIRSGPKEPISEDSDLFKDYAALEKWAADKPLAGRIETSEGWLQVVAGDWIVTGEDGDKLVVKPDIFKVRYEPVD